MIHLRTIAIERQTHKNDLFADEVEEFNCNVFQYKKMHQLQNGVQELLNCLDKDFREPSKKTKNLDKTNPI